jgi:predicted tellurium resistance membrane protein TerC
VLDRFPVLVWLGAMLLGWVAGEVIATDLAVAPLLHSLLNGQIVWSVEATSSLFAGPGHFSVELDLMETLISLAGAVIVLIAGAIWRNRALRQHAKKAEIAAAMPVRGAEAP